MMSSEVEKLVTAGKLSRAEGEKLSLLPVGSFCQHKSWGAGRVAEWDLLADRMVIDFETKAGHSMKLSFALNSLEVLPPDSLLARRVGDLPALKKMAKEKPAELVELALTSNGNSMTLDSLEALIKGTIVADSDYKNWWTAAKKALKDKRHIVVPTKRTEMLTLRDQEKSHADTMVSNFLAARDLKGKLAALAMIQRELDLFANPAEELLPVLDDISSTVKKAAKLHPKESLQLLLCRNELLDAIPNGVLPAGSLTVEEHLRDNRPQIADASSGLPVALLTRMYRAFPGSFPEREWVQECLKHLTRTNGRALDEITQLLDINDELDVLIDYLKRAVRNRLLSTDLLIWMCKERKKLSEPVFDMELGNAIIGALEDDHLQGGPKKTSRLHDAFVEDLDLVPEMIEEAEADELVIFSKRIKNSPVFEELTRRSLMGRIIKKRPETQSLMDEGGSKEDNSLIVSWDSMERRKLELEELTRVKIPQNKKDIQIAREYGDLRENFEYKSAREQQAVLLRMQSKMERELRHARGTDFANVPTDQVGIGTIVEMEDVQTGVKETQSLLGAWDGDPDKQILSYLSEMGKALIGKRVGEEAELPTDQVGIRKVRVTAIKPYKV
jgi:transcription elongation GreA/GreB family factor